MSISSRDHSRRSSLPTGLDAPTQHTNSGNPPHRTHLPSFHLPHISPTRAMRRSSDPLTFEIHCSSGPARRTHSILSTCTSRRRGAIQRRDVFHCIDGVNAARLLFLTREAMDSQVQRWGGNAMVDEAWSYTIRRSRSSQQNLFKVSITYTGVAADCDRPDPRVPVAIEEARGVPGLMTVLSRE